MEPQSQGPSDDATVSGAPSHHHINGDSVADYTILSAACNLCGRIIQSAANEMAADLEIFSLCGDCKFLLLEDLGTPAPYSSQRHSARRIRRRTTHSSSESIEDLSSQQFARLINMARQSLSPALGYENQHADSESAARLLRHTSSRTTPSGSRRWRWFFSDTESEDFDNFDYHYGETESNASFSQYRFFHGDNDAISFSAYGGESDASMDEHGFLDTEIFVQPDDRSDIDIDTDIDPMHAGLDQWNSDDQEGEDEEDGEWEDADAEGGTGISGVAGTQFRNYLASPSESYSSITLSRRLDSPDFEGRIRQRIRESRQVLSRSIFTSLEDMEFPPYVGNAGDYLDERGFEELLEQLAESDNSRRGAPPAAVSFVRNLARVIIDKEQEKNGDAVACAICKELFALGSEANQLPCLHLYHAQCILPWLSARNSCPLCRYELPTDDKDYEEGKQNASGGIETQGMMDQDASEDSSSDDVSEAEGEETVEISPVAGERDERDSGVDGGGRGRWLFLAAAPVVSLVGIVLAVWLSNPQRRGIIGPHNQRGNRSRRWLPFF